MCIRKACKEDLSRIAEIFVFNNRVNYLPIFKDEEYSFHKLQVVPLVFDYLSKEEIIQNLYVYDDGVIKGFVQMSESKICKLYVDTFFQNQGIGSQLIQYVIREFNANSLWVLEKNIKAISFYQRHGFDLTNQRKYE